MTTFVISGAMSLIVLVLLLATACLLYKIWRVTTLSFVSREFNEMDRKGVREEMRKMGDEDILKHLGRGPTPSDIQAQRFLQYVYAFNRIGGGIKKGYLSKVIFETWMPFWFVDHWKKFQPLVEQERKRRKIPGLYGNFEWLANYCAKKK